MTWQVLHVRPRCEKKTAEFCRIQKLDFYLPLRSETKIYQRRKVTVEKPVFPGYVFSSFDRDGRLALLKTNHIVRVLTPGSEDELIGQLEQVKKALSVDATLSTVTALKKGSRVRITAGPFMGVEGMVTGLKSVNLVRLNVDIIGQAVVVEVDRAMLEPSDW
jgi:transcription antitermination factor NusG